MPRSRLQPKRNSHCGEAGGEFDLASDIVGESLPMLLRMVRVVRRSTGVFSHPLLGVRFGDLVCFGGPCLLSLSMYRYASRTIRVGIPDRLYCSSFPHISSCGRQPALLVCAVRTPLFAPAVAGDSFCHTAVVRPFPLLPNITMSDTANPSINVPSGSGGEATWGRGSSRFQTPTRLTD